MTRVTRHPIYRQKSQTLAGWQPHYMLHSLCVLFVFFGFGLRLVVAAQVIVEVLENLLDGSGSIVQRRGTDQTTELVHDRLCLLVNIQFFLHDLVDHSVARQCELL